MAQELFQIALVVDDYDKALDFYIRKLNFHLIEDTILTPHKRWVVIQPPGSKGCKLLLAKAKNEIETAAIGNQTGGRVFLFLHTDDFEGDLKRLREYKIEIVRGPVDEPYGRVLVFKDNYGNLWDLIQPK
ncbi:MAG: VOC family protein [Saprospiraceae bacterium]